MIRQDRGVGMHLSTASALLVALVLLAPETPAGQSLPADVICGTGLGAIHSPPPRDVAGGEPLFVAQIPSVLTPGDTGPVALELVYAGTIEAIRVFYFRGAGYSFDEFARAESRVLAGRAVSVFRPSWAMADFVLKFGLAIDYESGQGAALFVAPASVPLGANGMPAQGHGFSVRSMSRTVRSVPVVRVDDTVQYSSHVVNLVLPGLADSLGPAGGFQPARVAQRFYQFFGDHYDHLGIVFSEKPFQGTAAAYHTSVQNSIAGIGQAMFDESASFGSAGALHGVDVFFNSLGNVISNHELSHQWGHFFDWQAIAGITRSDRAHTPLWGHVESPIPVLIMPWLRLVPSGGLEWQALQAAEPTRIPPLQAYAMGLLDTAQVPPIDIFEDQNRRFVSGGVVSGATRRVTIDQIVAQHGPRSGARVDSLRRATILISRERLADQREMDFWTLLAQRLEDPHHTGMINESGIGSFHAISGVPLHTALVLPPGQTLAGHTLLEPAVLDRGDLWGIELDREPPLDVPAAGVFRMRGRIVDPVLRSASRISVTHGNGVVALSSPVGTDGTFNLLGSPERTPGRASQRVSLTIGATSLVTTSLRNVRLFGDLRIPPPPVALEAAVSGSNVTLRWSPATGSIPSTYFVDAGSRPGTSDIGSFPAASAMLGATNVANGTYYVRVRAANSAGISAPSSETTVTVGCEPPEPPTSLAGTVDGSVVALTWGGSTTASVSYAVVAGSTSGATNLGAIAAGTATSLIASAPAGRYFVRVRAVSACGAAHSNEIEFVVGLAPLPGVPGDLTHQVVASTVAFTWQAATGIVSGYVIEAGSAPGLANLATLAVGNTTAWSVPGVPSGTYFVRVKAVNGAGHGPPSNDVLVVVP